MTVRRKSGKTQKWGIRGLLRGILLLSSGCLGCAGYLGFLKISEGRNKIYKEMLVSGESTVDVEGISVEETTASTPAIEILSQQETVYEPEETEYDEAEGGIHRYEYYKDDCSWSEAFDKAVSAGGYLARINSREEFDYIVNQLSDKGFNKMLLFRIGGRRDFGSEDYYWVNEKNMLYGSCINSSNYWAEDYGWMENEPSYTDSYDNKTTDEDKLVLYKFNNSWLLNDSADDIVGWYPNYSGKVGYIVEYED